MSAHLRYLGSADEIDLGGGIVAQKGGDPVEVDDERAEYVTALPGEQFEDVNDEEWDAFQKEQAAKERAAQKRQEALEAASEKYREEAEAQAAARAGFYGAETQEQADAAVLGAPAAPASPSPASADEPAEPTEPSLEQPAPPQRPERQSRAPKGTQAASDPDKGEEK